MKALISTLICFLIFVSCAQTQNNKIIAGNPTIKPGEKVAYFAEGCFWHSEIVFQSLIGVRDAISGYAGGNVSNPTYEQVCSGNTGHAETVKVYYDPKLISFQELTDAFFTSQDPTTLNRQGNDIGTEYRSIAFYSNAEEKKIITDAITKLNASKKFSKPVVTEVKKFIVFYPAELYHQEYILNKPGNSYVKNVSIPDYIKFKKEFKGKFKQ